MENARFIPPDLDDRSWKDIVEQAKALIPTYTPQWTDSSPTDPGMALIELFAWIVEGMIYRLNRVPDKNYQEFLNLLGIMRDPATPAHTNLTFKITGPGPLLIPAGTQIATPQTNTKESVVFETDSDITALPINLTRCIAIEKQSAPIPYRNVTDALVKGPLADTTVNVPHGSASLVLLGFDRPTTQPIRISLELGTPVPETAMTIQAATYVPSFTLLTIQNDGTEGLQQSGDILVQPPGTWQVCTVKNLVSIWPDLYVPATSADQITDSLYWLGVFFSNASAQTISVVLGGVGFNSAPGTNALSINLQQTEAKAEAVGISDETAFQVFALKNAPLYKDLRSESPYRHLVVQVREPLPGGGFALWDTWSMVDEIPAGPGKVYRCNPVSAEIMFGNYQHMPGQGNGTIPPAGSEIRALNYRYVAGGASGNVPANTITAIRTGVPGMVSACNPGAGKDGSDQEGIDDAKRRAPQLIKNRSRAVTIEDYEFLAGEATTDIAKTRALPARLFESGIDVGKPWAYAGLDRSPGRVNVIVVPRATEAVVRPKPDAALIAETTRYLDQRRTAAASLLVSAPRYLPIIVKADLCVWQKAIDSGLIPDAAAVRTQVLELTKKFLHPLYGNLQGAGWEVGQHIFMASLFEYIRPKPEIGFINGLQIKADVPDYHDPLLPWTANERPYPINIYGVWVQLADYELICSGAHVITHKVL